MKTFKQINEKMKLQNLISWAKKEYGINDATFRKFVDFEYFVSTKQWKLAKSLYNSLDTDDKDRAWDVLSPEQKKEIT